MDGKLLARLGAVVFVAVAITATAIEMTRKEEEPRRPGAAASRGHAGRSAARGAAALPSARRGGRARCRMPARLGREPPTASSALRPRRRNRAAACNDGR